MSIHNGHSPIFLGQGKKASGHLSRLGAELWKLNNLLGGAFQLEVVP